MTATSPPTGSSSSNERLFDKIAEEFLERHRGGEQPDPSEYARRYPHVADQLSSYLETVQKLEQAGSSHRQKQLPREEIEALTTDLKIIERIGTGGMGSVWKATQLSLDRLVAVKVLHHVDWTQSSQLLLEEARIASSLSHEHIVPVHGVFPEAKRPYFVMQFIAGCSLSQVISAWKKQRDGEDPAAEPGSALTPGTEFDTLPYRHGQCTSVPPRSFSQIAAWMQQAAAAVSFAHQNNVLHRDLKPANFIIDEKQKIWLTDFGLAKRPQHTAMSLPGQAAGTLRYMSPEQSDGHATTLSDVYSLGVTLYEMLALKPAFTSHSTRSLQQQITAGSCPSLHSHDPGIPRDLAVITQKAMALRPQDRYQSAAALAEDLQRFIDGRPILARPMSAPEQLWRLIARHKLVSAISALATILLVATSAIAIYSNLLWHTGLDSEIARLVAEAGTISKSQLPGQHTLALEKIRTAVQLAQQSRNPIESLTTIRDNIATILDTPELKLSETLPSIDTDSLQGFVAARNRSRIIVKSDKSTLEVRDGVTGALLAPITLDGPISDFEISADGSLLLVGSLAIVKEQSNDVSQPAATPKLACWDLAASQPKLRWTIPGLVPNALTFLPNNQQCMTADSDGSLHRIDLATGQLLQLYPCMGPATEILLRPHPQLPIVAVCGGLHHEILFLNIDSGKIATFLRRHDVSGFDWHPEGHMLALHDQLREVELIQWPSLQPHKTIYKGVGLTHCRFSPDGRWLAIGTWSSSGSQTQLVTVRLEDQYTLTCPWPYIPDGKSHLWMDDGLEPATLFYQNRVYRALIHDPQLFQHFDVQDYSTADTPCLAPVENLPLIVANVFGVPGQVMNLQTGTTLTARLSSRWNSLLTYVSSVAWSKDRLTSLDLRCSRLWNIQPNITQTGDLLLKTRSRNKLPLANRSSALSPDGSRIFSTSPGGRMLYSPADNPLDIRSLPHEFKILKATSHTGSLAFCWRESDAVIYDCDSDKIIHTFDFQSDASFSPDGRYLLIYRGPTPTLHDTKLTLNLFRLSDRKVIRSFPQGACYSSFSESGSLLAMRFVSEQFIRLIETSNGDTLLKLPLEADNRGWPIFADNDRRLFIHSVGQTSHRLYSINLVSLLQQYSLLGLPVPSLQFSADPAFATPQTSRRQLANSARSLTFSSATQPLHLQVAVALHNSLRDLTNKKLTARKHFGALLASLSCDALELGCLDAASLTLRWLQFCDSPSAGVTAIQASILSRHNQPAQALQLLQSQNRPDDCDATCQFNTCLALQLLDRTPDSKTAADSLLLHTKSAELTFALNFMQAQPASHSLQDFINQTPKLLIRAQDVRAHQLALKASQQATQRWPDVADCWQIQALAEICNGLPAAATSSLAKARQLRQNRNDATMQLIESAIHLHNEDFQAWFISLLKTNQLIDQHAIGLTQLHTIGGDLPLAITLQVPVRSQSLSGRLYRWLLLAESQFLGRTHVDVILKTRNGL
ncbi:MAG: protein kinase domain-containing protein [Planctomycetaceae bacterium]